MSIKKLTIVKLSNSTVRNRNFWENVFRTHSLEDAIHLARENYNQVDQVDWEEGTENTPYLTVVKIGDESYHPTTQDLEVWRATFEDAKGDPNFTVFTHESVSVQRLPISINEPFVVIS